MKRVVIITGASRGIGYNTALKFHDRGWDVINLARTACKHPFVKNIQVDLSHITWPQKIGSELRSMLTNYHNICIVHNAAILQKDSIYTLEANRFAQVLQLNVIAPQQLNQLLLPLMPKASAIIYVASTLATIGVPSTASYIASKHALLGLMRATLHDLADSGIHTVCICPGCTDTEMLHTHAQHDPAAIAAKARLAAFNRLVQPEEIADTIYFASTQPVLNGSVIHANLGQL